MKVNTFIMGTQKGGTTALFTFLASHPAVSAPRKEPHFFDLNGSLDSPDPTSSYAGYHDRLGLTDAPVRLEATPIYMYAHRVRDRLHRYNPDAKLIFILRRPWDRAHSQWRMNVARGGERQSFEAGLEREVVWAKKNPSRQRGDISYVDRGFYARQIQRLLERFDLAQMLFLTTDQLRNQHDETLDRVSDFLGLERFAEYPPARTVLPRVAVVDTPEMNRETRARLVEEFTPDLQQLAQLTGLDLADWLS